MQIIRGMLSCQLCQSSLSRRSKKTRVIHFGVVQDKYLYDAAEVLIPGKFASKGLRRMRGKPVVMQYLEHSTHSPEKDKIWRGGNATFKGNPKFAGIRVLNNYCSVTSWKASDDYTSLSQLLSKCDTCPGKQHKCKKDCCCAIKDPECLHNYADLASKTCKATGTCNGKDCYKAGRVFPGSYLWLSKAYSKADQEEFCLFPWHKVDKELEAALRRLNPDEFLANWDKENNYGVHSFIVDIRQLLDKYSEQVAGRRKIVLRCGGTLWYTKEVCYVVIITFEGDGIHDELPPVNSPKVDTADRDSPECDWSSLLDEDGYYAKDGYPTFTYHKKLEYTDNWDHFVFAVHLPKGKELSLPKETLVGGGPQKTVHRTCHKYRKFGKDAMTRCKENEECCGGGASPKAKASRKRHATQ